MGSALFSWSQSFNNLGSILIGLKQFCKDFLISIATLNFMYAYAYSTSRSIKFSNEGWCLLQDSLF